jgi:hypothetical protein
MVAKKNKTSEKEEKKKGRVKVGNLEATKEVSVEEAKNVKGGKATPSDIQFYTLVTKNTPVLAE